MRKEVFLLWLVVVVALAGCAMYVSTEVAECYKEITIKYQIRNHEVRPTTDD